jgi:large subunit ribosomal protein L22
MRLVVDLIRGKNVNEAYAILQFSKKQAARQIAKTLKSAVANAEQHATRDNEAFDLDELVVVDAQIDMGTPLKRFTAAAQGRATPIRKPTSHVRIAVAPKGAK